MRTEAQILASRLNGAKSRGPVTPEGKRRSAANALRHGCRAATPELVQTPSSRTPEQEQQAADRYNALVTRLRNHWKPTTPDLERLVGELATICLRINRLHQCEEDILSFAQTGRRTGGPRTNEELERAALTLRSLKSLMRHDAQLNHARAAIEAQLSAARESEASRRFAHARTSEPASEPGATVSAAGMSDPTGELGKPVATTSATRPSQPTSEPGATVSAAGMSDPTGELGKVVATTSATRPSQPTSEPGATVSAAGTSEPAIEPARPVATSSASGTSEPASEPGKPGATISAAGTSEPAIEPGKPGATVSAAGTSEPVGEPARPGATVSAAGMSEPAIEPGKPGATISAAGTSEPAIEPGKPVATSSAAGTSGEPVSDPTRPGATISATRPSEPRPQPASASQTNNIRPASEPGAQPRRPTYGHDGRRIRYPDLAA